MIGQPAISESNQVEAESPKFIRRESEQVDEVESIDSLREKAAAHSKPSMMRIIGLLMANELTIKEEPNPLACKLC